MSGRLCCYKQQHSNLLVQSVFIISAFLFRLSVLNLESLEVRRLKNDLVTCFKILNGYTNITATGFFYTVWRLH